VLQTAPDADAQELIPDSHVLVRLLSDREAEHPDESTVLSGHGLRGTRMRCSLMLRTT
jgi:hypothetical protein